MENLAFFAAFALIFLGLFGMIAGLSMSPTHPRRLAVRLFGMFSTAAALALMGIGFIIPLFTLHAFAGANLVFAALAGYFAYDTVKKALAEKRAAKGNPRS